MLEKRQTFFLKRQESRKVQKKKKNKTPKILLLKYSLYLKYNRKLMEDIACQAFQKKRCK